MSESAPAPSPRSVRLERHGPAAELVLCHPRKGNAMGPAFWTELPAAVAAADADPGVRVLLLRADGDNFCFGLDLMGNAPELGPLITGPTQVVERTALLRLIERWQQAVDSLARARKPVVAAVQGWCIGGGLDVVSACDVRVCASDARFSLRETRMAMVADIGSLQRLPGIIGHAATAELAFTGGDITSARAVELGLVSRVFEDGAALLAGARALAAEIAANPPLVVQGVKQVLNVGRRREVQAGLDYVALWNAAFVQSDDLVEALTAFAEKRDPVCTGR
jgi:enoyl-CoA hydratase